MSRDSYLYDVGGAPSVPPFRFSGVRMRMFPLRASLSRLREFCHRYLNGFPDVAEFRPLDGFVELVVLEYPSITSVEQPAFATYGQTEIFFLVPVMWKERATGKQHFAVITPYIFVDNPVSARIGRDLFGWPKEPAWYRREAAATHSGPGLATQLVAVDTEVLSANGTRASRLLEIDDQPDREWLSYGKEMDGDDLPLDLNGILRLCSRPWQGLSRGMALSKRALMDLLTQPRTPFDLLNINVKQIPQLDPEGTAAYQALTVTPLRTTRLTGFGLIGERKQVLGDPSGGCVVRVFEDPTWPVVTKLGLRFESSAPESSKPGARTIYRFKPVFPLWCSADIDQHESRILVSRGTPASAALGGTTGPRVPLNTALGSRPLLGATSGTTLSGVKVQLFSLRAEPEAHQKIVDELNGIETDYWFELPKSGAAAGSMASVVLSVATFEGMSSDRLSLAGWHGTVVELFMPIRYRRHGQSEAEAVSGFFSHAGFANSSALANSIHDVLGGNVMLAKMRRGDTATIAQGVDNRLHVFRLSASVVPQFQLGERAQVLPIIDVFGRPRPAGEAASLASPVIQQSGLNVVDLPCVPILRLKQLPSAEDSSRCSYQALVKSEWLGARGTPEDVGIDHDIRLFGYDSLNLVRRLGLDRTEPAVVARIAERTDDHHDRWQVYCRPFAESLLVLSGEVALRSQVLWERRLG